MRWLVVVVGTMVVVVVVMTRWSSGDQDGEE
jgi:hypothetical protein